MTTGPPSAVSRKTRVAGFVARRPGTVLISFSVMFVMAFLVTGRLHFEQDIFKVLPDRNHSFEILAHAMKTSTAQNRLLLLVRREPSTPTRELIARGRQLVKQLKKVTVKGKPALARVTCEKKDALAADFVELLTRFVADPGILLTQPESRPLFAFLDDHGAMAAELRKTLALYATPGAGAAARLAVIDPLNLRRFMTPKLQLLHQGMTFAPGEVLLSPDRSALLVMAEPTAVGKAAGSSLLEQIEAVGAAGGSSPVGITGGFAITAQEEKLVKGDIITSLAGSAAAIALLFLLVYRSLVVLSFLFIPLAVGLQLAMGTMALFSDRIHMLALAFAAVILGLGIDFAIHVYDRFHAERRRGKSPSEAVETSVFKTGSAVVAGGLTTLAAFLAITVAGSPVLTQIGWLVAAGLFFCLMAILWVLPAWLVWIESRLSGWLQKGDRDLGMILLGERIEKWPLPALLLSCSLFLAALPGIARLEFETNPLALRPRALAALDVQQELAERFAGGSRYAIVAWPAQDSAALWEGGQRVDRLLEGMKPEEGVISWSSLSRMASASPLDSAAVDVGVIADLLADYGFALADFPSLERFLRASGRDSGLSANSCFGEGRFPPFFDRFAVCGPSGASGLVWVQLADAAGVRRFSSTLRASFPEALVVTPGLAVDELMNSARTSLWLALGLAAVFVILILAVFFRDAVAVLLALAPVTMGVTATAGVMGYAGIHLNIFNFIVLPILVGIGMDDGIHILSRFRETGSVRETIATTGRSVLVTSLTTMMGFGSLLLARYHVLSGMGAFAITGILACFLFSVVTLAALLGMREGT